MMMIRAGLLVFVVTLAGCGKSDPPADLPKDGDSPAPKAITEHPSYEKVRAIIVEQMQVSPDAIKPDVTFAQLGSDELDIVEIVMEVEDQFKIVINDSALEKGISAAGRANLPEHLTVGRFVQIVAESKPAP